MVTVGLDNWAFWSRLVMDGHGQIPYDCMVYMWNLEWPRSGHKKYVVGTTNKQVFLNYSNIWDTCLHSNVNKTLVHVFQTINKSCFVDLNGYVCVNVKCLFCFDNAEIIILYALINTLIFQRFLEQYFVCLHVCLAWICLKIALFANDRRGE